MATWDTAYINALPDSAFAYIEPGGTKDSSGRTVPRSLRHFPHHDESGQPDRPHVANAMARIPQSDLPAAAKASAEAHIMGHEKTMGMGQSAKALMPVKAAILDEDEQEAPSGRARTRPHNALSLINLFLIN